MIKYKGNLKYWVAVGMLIEPETRKIKRQQISPLLSKKDKKGGGMKKDKKI